MTSVNTPALADEINPIIIDRIAAPPSSFTHGIIQATLALHPFDCTRRHIYATQTVFITATAEHGGGDTTSAAPSTQLMVTLMSNKAIPPGRAHLTAYQPPFASGTSILIRTLSKPTMTAANITLSYTTAIPNAVIHYLRSAIRLTIVHPQMIVAIKLFAQTHTLTVTDIRLPLTAPQPDNVDTFTVGNDTTIAISNSNSSSTSSQQQDAPIIGGLANQLETIRSLIEISLYRTQLFAQLHTRPPKGILLYGHPGTGKTLLARSIAHSLRASFHIVNGPELISAFVGESEAKLIALFKRASQSAPAVIFIDEIDSIGASRHNEYDNSDTLSHRLTSTLLTLLDGINSDERVIVVAATNRPDALDTALRRPGRFDREIEIPIPNNTSRHEILIAILQNVRHTLSNKQVKEIADITHGFVGADLHALCRESAMQALHRHASSSRDLSTISTGADQMMLDQLAVTYDDVRQALVRVKPSSMRELLLDIPTVHWSDIGGQSDIKARLHEAIEWPITHPHIFTALGITPPKGILLYGPPGCSKTMIAKALACESHRNFIAVRGPELYSQWVGESEKAIKNVFRRARQAAPAIIFFDEIDSIAAQRTAGGGGSDGSDVTQRVLSQLLIELDGVEPLRNVTILAATNRPDLIDKSLLRPGRIDRMLFVAPPDESATQQIVRIELQRMSVSEECTVEQISSMIERQIQRNFDKEHQQQTISISSPTSMFDIGSNTLPSFTTVISSKPLRFSGAELSGMFREAAMNALTEDVHCLCVELRHFAMAIENTKTRLTEEMMTFYERYAKTCSISSI